MDRDSVPWYRQFWPWFLIAVPASGVVGGLATVWIAMADPQGLVVDDYYKAGLAINRVIARDRAAERLGLAARVSVERPPPATLELTLSADEPVRYEVLELRWLHPTRAGADRTVRLVPVAGAPARYRGSVGELPPGEWHLQLEPPSAAWRMVGRMRVPGSAAARLAPAATP
ncbi:MAG: FixH family protein [Gammaproteobacteria bacterium]|nr:FixH family protein [Gammaproteobacteria bacterium]NIR58773.1 FixH family protein [Gammaproteobacteria bacterium]NIV73805.1 hypothetical protein [Gammaproteobacteria bacterium]